MELAKEQWDRIEPIITAAISAKDHRGRKPREAREVFDGILWILRTGAPWKDLPPRYPPFQTCHRRFLTIGRTRSIRTDCSGAGPGPVRARRHGHPRSFYRRDLCAGKKGVLLSARQTAERQQGPGHRRRCWFSCRRSRGKRIAP